MLSSATPQRSEKAHRAPRVDDFESSSFSITRATSRPSEICSDAIASSFLSGILMPLFGWRLISASGHISGCYCHQIMHALPRPIRSMRARYGRHLKAMHGWLKRDDTQRRHKIVPRRVRPYAGAAWWKSASSRGEEPCQSQEARHKRSSYFR